MIHIEADLLWEAVSAYLLHTVIAYDCDNVLPHNRFKTAYHGYPVSFTVSLFLVRW